LLARAAQPAEAAGWAGSLDQPQQIVQGIVASTEYHNTVVRQAYETYLGRTPAPGEVAGWSQQLQHGLGEKSLEAAFLGSAEYDADHGGTDQTWLQGLYADVLGRSPDPVGLASWGQAMQQGVSHGAVALAVLDSGEANARLVTSAYQTFLHRNPDPTGTATFGAALDQGLSPTALFADLAGSPEYRADQASSATDAASGAAAPQTSFHLQFGSGKSPTGSGYTEVPLVSYAASRGYGWESLTGLHWRDRQTADPLTRTFHMGHDGTFDVDLPNGTYQVTLTLGDPWLPHGAFDVWAGATQLATGLKTTPGQFLRPTYTVAVTNGSLHLHLAGEGDRTTTFALDTLDIMPTPVTGPLTVSTGGAYTATTGWATSFVGITSGGSTAPAGLQYLWQFGDGARSTERAPSHAYAKAGVYNVTLTVQGQDGEAVTAATTATVTNMYNPDCDNCTPLTVMPDFAAHPTVVSVTNGAWSDPRTWSTGQTPAAGAVVIIARNTTVSYDLASNAALNTVEVQAGGQLHFRTDMNTHLVVGTLLVLAGGDLEIGMPDHPVAANVSATVTFADQPINLATDPGHYGTGLIAFGTVTVAGAAKTPFPRLAAEPHAGDTTLTLAEPISGWQAGDELFLPDTRQLGQADRYSHYVPEWEYLTVKNVSADGRVVSLAAPLRFNHPGARNPDGVLEFLPQVANQSRNIMFASANPDGTRGQTLFTDRANVDIRYTAFCDLGRTTNAALNDTTFDASGHVTHQGTNLRGRYPMHFHHLIGPSTPQADGYQFTVIGNVIEGEGTADNPSKWGIVVHASSYGLIQDNIVLNVAGAGFVTEEGTETNNVFAHNFAARVSGNGDRFSMGREGAGFWFAGPTNFVRNNVATDIEQDAVYSYGFIIFGLQKGSMVLPAFQGADSSLPGQGVTVNLNATPLREFSGNEAYGALPNGLAIWGVGAFGTVLAGTTESVVKDFRVWNHFQYGFFGYPADHLTLDHFVARGNVAMEKSGADYALGIWFNDYLNRDLVIKNADIQGLDVGIWAPMVSQDETTIVNCYLRDAIDVMATTMFSVNGSTGLPARKIVLQDDLFRSLPGFALDAISLRYDAAHHNNLVEPDQIVVYNYNQVAGDNFQVYYAQQAPNFVVPQTVPGDRPLIGSPEAGLTNQQNWNKYHLAIGGAVAPTNKTQKGIDGFVQPL
jgi:hypothetical protein